MKKLIPILFIALLLASCNMTYDFESEEEKKFVGNWVNPYARISISPNGKFKYELKEGGKSVTMDSNVKRFEEGKMIINLFVTESIFNVQKTPFLNSEGRWEMKIDNRKYIKLDY